MKSSSSSHYGVRVYGGGAKSNGERKRGEPRNHARNSLSIPWLQRAVTKMTFYVVVLCSCVDHSSGHLKPKRKVARVCVWLCA